MKNAIVGAISAQEECEAKDQEEKKEENDFSYLSSFFFAGHYPVVSSRVRSNEQNVFDGHDCPV